jgi:hypothetical protein
MKSATKHNACTGQLIKTGYGQALNRSRDIGGPQMITETLAAVAIGLSGVSLILAGRWRHVAYQWIDQANITATTNDDILSALRNLRKNCFLTNEKGHRVRYSDASQAVRDRAEGGEG